MTKALSDGFFDELAAVCEANNAAANNAAIVLDAKQKFAEHCDRGEALWNLFDLDVDEQDSSDSL